jgi:hypothetical protein
LSKTPRSVEEVRYDGVPVRLLTRLSETLRPQLSDETARGGHLQLVTADVYPHGVRAAVVAMDERVDEHLLDRRGLERTNVLGSWSLETERGVDFVDELGHAREYLRQVSAYRDYGALVP